MLRSTRFLCYAALAWVGTAFQDAPITNKKRVVRTTSVGVAASGQVVVRRVPQYPAVVRRVRSVGGGMMGLRPEPAVSFTSCPWADSSEREQLLKDEGELSGNLGLKQLWEG